jgi:SAM-dependent methyltransferase/tetratricopeptide (TPR) repeat protein
MTLSERPGAAAKLNHAIALHKQGRLTEAGEAYRATLAAAPGLPPAHYNFAVLLRALGRRPEALRNAEAALKGDPGYVRAAILIADLHTDAGDAVAAIDALVAARRRLGTDPAFNRRLERAFAAATFAAPNRAAEAAIADLLAGTQVDYQALAHAGLSLLRTKPTLARLLAAVANGRTLTDKDVDRLAGLPLLADLFAQAILADADIEALAVALRRALVPRLAAGPPSALVEFAAAVALQFDAVEYVYDETAAEATAADALSARPAAGFAPWLVALALYRPLGMRADRTELAAIAPPGPRTALLWRRQIHNPIAERTIAAQLPNLTPIADTAISHAVREQYEENPYPRWLSVGVNVARRLDQVVGALFPHRHEPRRFETCRILIAGCGTGQHAVRTALRYSGAAITAVDLSRTSLAYAARQAAERGLTDLAFAQADIVRLGALAQRFDLIEVSGVLMCLGDPIAGWQTLAGLLAPGGYMRVGLYSAHARRDVAAARDVTRDYPRTLAGIRAARAALRALPPDHDARTITPLYDFFSASTCRDLFMAAQEIPFTLPAIRTALDRIGLEFLGFEVLPAGVAAAYRARFPADPAMIDLGNWDAFERDNPGTFRTMYQFWCAGRG